MDLSQYTVLEVGGYVSAPYAGQLLAGVGADVIKVEPPGGDVARRVGPFHDDTPGTDTSAYFGYLNAGKRSVTLDPDAATAREVIDDLVSEHGTDLVIENRLAAYGVDPRSLADRHDGLVVVSVSGFGTTGPWQEYAAPEIIAAAESGQMHKMGYPHRPPTRLRIKALDYMGGQYAALSGLAALYHRDAAGGAGQHVDVAKREAGASSLEYYLTGYSWSGETSERQGDSYANQGDERGLKNLYPAADGYISTVPPQGPRFEVFAEEIADRPELLEDERFETVEARREHEEAVYEVFEEYTSQRGKWELFEELQSAGHPATVTATPEDVLSFDHLEVRDFWQEVELPNGEPVRMPGFPFRVDGSRVDLEGAPALGEHDAEIYAGPGYDPGLRESTRGREGSDPPNAATSPSSGGSGADARPFEGIRVVDFTWIAAGPQATKLLAALGADVVKIESANEIDGLRQARSFGFENPRDDPNASAWFADFNQGKRSVRADLTTERGREIVRELIAEADVLAENYSPAFMDRVGLEYEDAAEINPELVYLSMPGLGKEGPLGTYRSYGNTLQSMAGLDHMSGFPDDPPTSSGQSWPDPVSGTVGAVAVAMALAHRERTGEGTYIELPQFETTLTYVHKVLSAYLLHGRLPERVGNRDEDRRYVQGVYECAGEDRWAAVAVGSDAHWEALCAAIGRPELADDERFRGQYRRLENHDAIDGVIEGWTRERSREEVRARLRDRGVPAGIVADERDLLEYDPQLRARGYVLEHDHPVVGRQRYAGFPARFSGSVVETSRYPCFGEHTGEVLAEWLGMGSGAIERAEEEGALH